MAQKEMSNITVLTGIESKDIQNVESADTCHAIMDLQCIYMVPDLCNTKLGIKQKSLGNIQVRKHRKLV